jgi:peptidyl-prolyl cis-trans isomerase-like 4
MSVLLDTTHGSVTIDLFTASAPRACLNFLKLCKLGAYRGCLFFNVQQNFVAQTGDPTGTGRGGDSVFGLLYGSQARFFEPEVRPHLRHARRGTVSMVPGVGGGNGSQFLVTLADGCASLDERHTVFGEVAQESGWPPALAALNGTLCDEGGRPFVDARVLRAHVLVDPFEDPAGLSALLPPPGSPPWRVPPAETVAPRLALDEAAAAAEEAAEAAAGRALSAEERAARAKQRAEEEARSRAVLLEMVGDLPSADVKPPDTALFVCKLNPVTTAAGALPFCRRRARATKPLTAAAPPPRADLTLIFSRFGEVTSCDVVKDPKTGESLCYAFLSFAQAAAAEAAYLKMDNVLIDDRRIRVDFSQSVAKVWNAHRRGETARPLEGGGGGGSGGGGPRWRAPARGGGESGGGALRAGGPAAPPNSTAGGGTGASGGGQDLLAAAMDRLRERGVDLPVSGAAPPPRASAGAAAGGDGGREGPRVGEGGREHYRHHDVRREEGRGERQRHGEGARREDGRSERHRHGDGERREEGRQRRGDGEEGKGERRRHGGDDRHPDHHRRRYGSRSRSRERREERRRSRSRDDGGHRHRRSRSRSRGRERR